MNRDPYYLRRRNALIYRAFLAAQSPTTPTQKPAAHRPTMRLYAHLAQQFFLSEETIRQIILHEKRKNTSNHPQKYPGW